MSATPQVWRAGAGDVAVRFVGRGGGSSRRETLRRVEGKELPVAWLEQRHSAICREGRAGGCGEGDALWTRRRGLALCVATADCVPVVVAAGGGITAVHAGWRGVVAGVVDEAVDALAAGLGERPPAAWIGPAIGPCCYEVGEEVAARVEASCAIGVTRPGRATRPHLDLVAAVEAQLRAAGVEAIERLGPCTRCSPELLCSYRRDGAAAGRNLTFAWRDGEPGGDG